MHGRRTALTLALVFTLALAGCAHSDGQGSKTSAGRLSDRGSSGTEFPAQRRHTLIDDGRYYAGADGRVAQRPDTGTWEKLGRELRDSWDRMLDGTEKAARDLEQDARDKAHAAGESL